MIRADGLEEALEILQAGDDDVPIVATSRGGREARRNADAKQRVSDELIRCGMPGGEDDLRRRLRQTHTSIAIENAANPSSHQALGEAQDRGPDGAKRIAEQPIVDASIEAGL